MFIKTISFEDLEGNPTERTFNFHMNKADLAEYMLGKDNDFPTWFREVIKRNSYAEIIQVFKSLVSASVGRKHEDGISFEKNADFTRQFMQSNAYSVFFEEMMGDTNKMIEFFNGVMPKDIAEEFARRSAEQKPRNNNQTGAKRKKNRQNVIQGEVVSSTTAA